MRFYRQIRSTIWMGLFSALCILFLQAGDVFAGAWTMGKGESYHRFAVNVYTADEEYDSDGDTAAMAWNGDFDDFNLNYYGEYGIFDTLTAFGSIYYKELCKDNDRYKYETSGMGDVDLGLRYRLHSNKIGVLSVQGLVKIPEFYDEDEDLALGNGQYDVELRLQYGLSLWALFPGYMNFEAGYRWRAETPSDEFRYLVEIGSDLGSRFYARAKLDALVSMDNAGTSNEENTNPSIVPEYDLAKLDMTIGARITRAIGLELGCTPAVWGESTARGTTWTVAISGKFQPK